MKKTIAIIIGTLLAVCVLTIAVFVTFIYISAKSEEYSRAGIEPVHGKQISIYGEERLG